MIKRGETKTFEFKISVHDMGYYGRKCDYITESGKIIIGVGTDSENLKLTDIYIK